MDTAISLRKGSPPGRAEEILAIRDENAMVPKPFFDAMPILVAGGTGEKSMIMPCWGGGAHGEPGDTAAAQPALTRHIVKEAGLKLYKKKQYIPYTGTEIFV